MQNCFKILKIKQNSSPQEIKEAYWKLAHKYHPDKGGNKKIFITINHAYKQALHYEETRSKSNQAKKIIKIIGLSIGIILLFSLTSNKRREKK
ncbi:MAG: DnaJ domain-containing protein [Candidatus Moranbacteria bacterium]|nr:DnaJ domain-containing protein [Candidatus Moranbacteria bacterium]